MKVLFFIGQLQQGGAERVISIISGKLAEKGFDVEILVYYDREINYEIDNKVKVTIVEKENKTTNKLKNLFWIRNYFNNNADVVISFLAPFNILALLTNTKKPIIVADRNDPRRIPNNKYIRKLRDLLYKKADAVVVQTEYNKEYFKMVDSNKLFVISNPIDLKEKIGIALNTKKENTIVSVGRLMKQKNQIMLIDAFNEIYKNHPEYKLIIYGEGNYRKELENRINDLKLNDVVELPGETTEVLDKIKSAKVFVLPSDYEGMPNALAEAMCIGLPCISTKVSGTDELIQDGINGLLIDINDKDALIKRLEYLLNDDDKCKEIGKNSIQLNEVLNIKTIVETWANLIKEIAK